MERQMGEGRDEEEREVATLDHFGRRCERATFLPERPPDREREEGSIEATRHGPDDSFGDCGREEDDWQQTEHESRETRAEEKAHSERIHTRPLALAPVPEDRCGAREPRDCDAHFGGRREERFGVQSFTTTV